MTSRREPPAGYRALSAVGAVQESGVTYLLWILVGSLLFGLGPLIATYKFIKNYNNLVVAYNARVAGGTPV